MDDLGLLASELGVVERRLPVRRHAVDDVTIGALHAQRAKTQDYSRKTTTPERASTETKGQVARKIAWIVLFESFSILAIRDMILLYAARSSPAQNSACARAPLPPSFFAEAKAAEHETMSSSRKGTREAMIGTLGSLLPQLEAMDRPRIIPW
jgi:hypothetical protein